MESEKKTGKQENRKQGNRETENLKIENRKTENKLTNLVNNRGICSFPSRSLGMSKQL
jgi:hypothetical protein